MRRFLVKFRGILDPNAFDVDFFLWITGPGRPCPMIALIDAPNEEHIPGKFLGTVLTYGPLDAIQISGTWETVREEMDLTDPVLGYS